MQFASQEFPTTADVANAPAAIATAAATGLTSWANLGAVGTNLYPESCDTFAPSP